MFGNTEYGSTPLLSANLKVMKANINYVSTKWFPISKIGWWLFYFKKYTYVKGFNLRICGIHFNIRENYATEKLLNFGR